MTLADEVFPHKKKLVRKEPSTKSARIEKNTRRQRYAVTVYRPEGETKEECDERVAEALGLGTGSNVTISVYKVETGLMEELRRI